MTDTNLDMLFWRPDLAIPNVTTVLEIVTLVERMKGGQVITCPSTMGTALIWRTDWPDMVSLIRRDLLHGDGEDLYGDAPSFYWHDFPLSLLERAFVVGFDEVLLHRAGEHVAVMVGPNENAPGWLSIEEFNQFADGYVELGLLEPVRGSTCPWSGSRISSPPSGRFLSRERPTDRSRPRAVRALGGRAGRPPPGRRTLRPRVRGQHL